MSQVWSRGQDVVDGEERGTATGRCQHAVVIGLQLLRWVVVRKMMHFQDYTRRKNLSPGQKSCSLSEDSGYLYGEQQRNPQGNHTTRSIFSLKSSEKWKFPTLFLHVNLKFTFYKQKFKNIGKVLRCHLDIDALPTQVSI